MRFLTYVKMAICLAGIYFPSTANADEINPEATSQLVETGREADQTGQQSTRSGWVPKTTTGATYSLSSDAPEGFYPDPNTKRHKEREQLRREYQGRTVGKFSYLSLQGVVDCPCGKDCKCPPFICDAGHCERNYVIMIGTTWCMPCRKMMPVVQKLRDEGYIVMYYPIDQVYDNGRPFKDLDAKFNVKSFPTFIVFDKGEEVERLVGTAKIQWFRDRLKTLKEQKLEEDQDNRYDNL